MLFIGSMILVRRYEDYYRQYGYLNILDYFFFLLEGQIKKKDFMLFTVISLCSKLMFNM